jgi:FkbM family methyltransferase
MFSSHAARTWMRYAPPILTSSRAAARLNLDFLHAPVSALARTRDGIDFPVDTTDLIQRFIYLFGVWEPNITAWIRSRLQPGDTFIDVGAHFGYYSTLASKLVGAAGHVVAVEPIDEFHRNLRHVLKLNNCDNVRTIERAATRCREDLSLWLGGSENLGNTSLHQDHVTQSYHRDHQVRNVAVSGDSLPALLTDAELEQASLIKIDVEGAESAVVEGLAGSLKRLRADVEIVMEVSPRILGETGHSVAEAVKPLVEEGFHIYRIPNSYDPDTYPSDLLRPRPPLRWNHPIDDQMDLVFSRLDHEVLTGRRRSRKCARGGDGD